ncbi:MAG: hypothetical protein AAF734_05450 [Bacteroidota bacterium]
MKVTARDFIQIWQGFMEDLEKNSQEKLEQAYVSNADWSKLLLGEKKPESKNTPLADYIRRNQYRSARYHKEYKGIDLVFVLQDNFSQIFALSTGNSKQEDLVDKRAFVPKFIDMLVEHETDINKCYEEMLRLVNHKARLKVLITYDWETTEQDTYSYMKNTIGENFHKIIQQANELFPENPETEYLLVIGYKTDEGKIAWNFYIYQIRANVFYTKYQPI